MENDDPKLKISGNDKEGRDGGRKIELYEVHGGLCRKPLKQFPYEIGKYEIKCLVVAKTTSSSE